MTCPHFSISIRSRYNKKTGSKGSAVAGAAYQSAQRLFCEYDGQAKNYAYKKPELVYSEVMLPANAPPEYADRSRLWNSVEASESRFDAQLARSIIAALPRELPMEQSIEMVREFCRKNFVDNGMCCDIAIHDPSPPGHNPHVHIMLTLRGIDENGLWLPKSRKEYILDKEGNRIRLKSGAWKSRKVDTVDWNRKENAEIWRGSWEKIQNRYLEKNKCPARVSLQSYANQGIDQIPTEHMGPAATAMEKKGIKTDVGNLNREIWEANCLLQSIRDMIRMLAEWIYAFYQAAQEAKAGKTAQAKEKAKAEAQAEPEPIYLRELIKAKLDIRAKERALWSHHAQTNGALRDCSNVMFFLEYMDNHGIRTVNDLNERLSKTYEKITSIRRSVKAAQRRIQTISNIRKALKDLRETRAVHDKYMQIGWKTRKEKFRAEHADDLNRYESASRFLHKNVTDDKISFAALARETRKLEKDIASYTEELADIQRNLKMLKDIRYFVRDLLPELSPEEKHKVKEKRSVREQLEANRQILSAEAWNNRSGIRKEKSR